MMTLPDLLPNGQTGWDFTPEQRAHVRKFYRVTRNCGIGVKGAKRLTISMVLSYYPENLIY